MTRVLKMVGYYHCDECDNTWKTGWTKSNNYKAAVKNMTDACPSCLDGERIVPATPHFISQPERMNYVKK